MELNSMHHNEPAKVLLAWSGGKDSMLALHALQTDPRYEVVALLTTLVQEYRRISHHGVREPLLEQQAAALGLPLEKVYLPASSCTNAQYEACMERVLTRYAASGVHGVAHGDIFLADLRAYRERNLAKVDLQGLFPLWGRAPREIIQQFEALGYRAYLCCVDAAKLGPEFLGCELGTDLLDMLPPQVDPCGEYGEYHTFVYAGPLFQRPLAITQGERVSRDGRHFIDLLPMAQPPEYQTNILNPTQEAVPQNTAGD
ncbi:hypothetical protein NB231_02848 [Nitrococcus mobilis Nb-231]|uniref:Diphthamide synthase domain-containing protein n=2 Tax=Nitrococcus mobilis TaxID=35797 RepID=A4BRU9_9GAMM|nr:hypothetical protein NB231_02848 [Nitrococcus mobilis Nb-231]